MNEHHHVRKMFVGTPARVSDEHGSWETALFKAPILGPVHIDHLNMAGDLQSDREHHGGPDKAVCVYPARHYEHWRAELGLDFAAGAFGENMSVSATEDEVCIGDIFGIGSAVVQISQPRQPCWKIGRRWGLPELPKLMLRNGRSGWYLRVLTPGFTESTCSAELLDRPFSRWTVADAFQLRYGDDLNSYRMLEFAQCSALPAKWRERLELRAASLAG